VEFTASGGSSQIYKVLNGFTIGTKYTSSIYVKYISGSGADFQILKSFGTAGVRCTFTNAGADLSVIAVGGTQANDFGKEDVGDGWFRIWFTYASNTTNWEINISRQTGTGSDVYGIYGFQIEAGSYATSYIPTYGTSVTRNQDTGSISSASSLIGQTEGTLFVKFKYTNEAVGLVGINAGNIGNRLYIGTDTYGVISQVRKSFSTQAFFSTPLTIGTTYKFALAYKENDFVLYMNGNQIGVDTNGLVPSSLSRIAFQQANGNDSMPQPLSEVLVFKTRLTNAELADLTTIRVRL